jgi:hypothetical protein
MTDYEGLLFKTSKMPSLYLFLPQVNDRRAFFNPMGIWPWRYQEKLRSGGELCRRLELPTKVSFKSWGSDFSYDMVMD